MSWQNVARDRDKKKHTKTHTTKNRNWKKKKKKKKDDDDDDDDECLKRIIDIIMSGAETLFFPPTAMTTPTTKKTTTTRKRGAFRASSSSSPFSSSTKKTTRLFVAKNVMKRGMKRRTTRRRKTRRCETRAFVFWSQEDELRKRFKQIATVVADELAIAYTGNTNVKLIRKGILFVAEYPLFSVGILMAGLSVAAAAASAVALPIALAAIGTLLPLIMFASFGALFAATAAAMVALTVLGPFLLSFSFFSGMSFVAVAAKAAVIVPAVMIGSTIWAIGSFGLKRTNVLMGEEILGGVDSDAVDEDAKFENINAVGSQDEEDEESTNEFARTILDRFDRQLLGDVDLWDSQEVSAWLKSESLDAAASIARRESVTGRYVLTRTPSELESLFQISSPKDRKRFESAFARLRRLANVKLD